VPLVILFIMPILLTFSVNLCCLNIQSVASR
jgi:hypothetical protein